MPATLKAWYGAWLGRKEPTFRHPRPKQDRLEILHARLDQLAPVGLVIINQIRKPSPDPAGGQRTMESQVVVAEQFGEPLRTRAGVDPSGVDIAAYWNAVNGADPHGLLLGASAAIRDHRIDPLESLTRKPPWLQ